MRRKAGVKLKKTASHKPDSVIPPGRDGHHLSGTAITGCLCLPTLDLGRAALKRSYTWHFSPQGLPATAVTGNCRELLPHVFILIAPKRDGYFLWHFLFLLNARPGYSPVRRSVLSGLSFLPAIARKTIAWLAVQQRYTAAMTAFG